MPNNVPPFADIARLVDHVLLNEHRWAEWEAGNDPLIKAAFVVETWLIANRMTPESQDDL
jgi:hypothetical protein